MSWTDEQDAALVAKLRAENAEFAEWVAGVEAGTTRLEGGERDAMRAGFWAGRQRADDKARAAATEGYTARQRVAYAVGYGEGRALPEVPQDATQPRSAAEIIRELREQRGQ